MARVIRFGVFPLLCLVHPLAATAQTAPPSSVPPPFASLARSTPGERMRTKALRAAQSEPELLADDIPVQNVRSRLEADFNPIGGRVGSFLLYPVASLDLGGTDNVVATDTSRRSDVVLDGNAGFRLVQAAEASRLVLQASAGGTVHAKVSDENSWRASGRLLYRRGPLDGSHLVVTATAKRDFVDRENTNNVVDARSPVTYAAFDGDASYTHRFNRFELTGGASIVRMNFNDATGRNNQVIDQNYRDYLSTGLHFEVAYQSRLPVAPLARGSVDWINYDFGPNDALFGLDPNDRNRDSTRYRLEGGVRFLLQDKLYGDVTVGYTARNFVAQAIPIKNVKGFSFETNLHWNMTPTITGHLKADRVIGESASRRIAGYRVTGGDLSLDYMPFYATIFTLSGGYHRVSPIGTDPDRDEYGFGVEVTHYVSRRYRVNAHYRHGARVASDSTIAYQANFFGVTGTSTF